MGANYDPLMLKVTIAMLGTVLLQAAAWLATAIADGTGPVFTIGAAGALSLASGALVFVVKQFGSGHLIHRDPAEATAKLLDLQEKLMELVAASHRREDASHKREAESIRREQILADVLLGRSREANDDARN